ncbi:hypothetical protein [Variovorax sp. UC122_21]|uniref:hypothetical protein n=1 Tax=Variovorax TaxID=34072 RepID=UPI00193297E2|nr:hypothetical protein INQ48_33100 [Variovorax paradoxus]
MEVNVMKSNRTFRSAATIACLLGVATWAQSQSLKREHVRAETAQSIRNGDIIIAGEIGLTECEIRRERCGSRAEWSGVSRGQVKMEFVEAVRSGAIVDHGVLMLSAAELAPHRYPARLPVQGKTRQLVAEEFELAKRLGDAPTGSEDGLTPAQRMPARFAAVRAEHRLALKNLAAAQ